MSLGMKQDFCYKLLERMLTILYNYTAQALCYEIMYSRSLLFFSNVAVLSAVDILFLLTFYSIRRSRLAAQSHEPKQDAKANRVAKRRVRFSEM